MNLPVYPLETSPDRFVYRFTSQGPKGVINKRVEYTELTEVPAWFNLGFGDEDDNGQLIYSVSSNNGDMRKVLATVSLTIPLFLEQYPLATIVFKGYDERRTNTYFRIIREYGADFEEYELWGFKTTGGYIPFDPTVLFRMFTISKKL